MKDSHHAEFNEGPSDGSPPRNNPNHWNRSNASFRDKLVGEIPGAFAHAFDFTDHMDVESDSENEDENINELHAGLVAIKLSKDTKKRLREHWCKAVIVKLVGRSVSFAYMQSKLNQIWKPKGRMEVVDLNHGFFLVRFFSKKDLNSVLRQGPWFLGDHLLSIRPWEPFFKASSANISLVAVWIRLYELPIELYKAEILREIRESTGKVLRIDTHTTMEARGKYARMCIQIDINKPLIDTILIKWFEQAVNYEGIQKLCFSYGKVGHLKEACLYTIRKNKVSADTAEASLVENDGSCNGHEECCIELPSTLPDKSTSGTSVVEEASCQYVPWMVVTRKKGAARGKKQNPSMARTTKSDGKTANQFPSKNMQVEHSKVGFNLNHVTTSNSSLGFGPNLNLDTEGKPNATFVGKFDPLPELAFNKKKNSHSVRGKKKIARNSPFGILLGCTVKEPFQGLSSKLTSLSSSASNNVTYGSEASPCDSFKFTASFDDGLGTKNSQVIKVGIKAGAICTTRWFILKAKEAWVLKLGVLELHLACIPRMGWMMILAMRIE